MTRWLGGRLNPFYFHKRVLLLTAMSSDGILVMDGPQEDFETLDQDLNILWTLAGAFLVFFMQCGFSMLEAGTVRKRNTVNILLKAKGISE